jgi:quinol monooxygenase YgiN
MYVLHVEFKPKSAELENLRSNLLEASQNLPNIDGCVAAELIEKTDNSSEFVLVEHWQTQTDHARHLKILQENGAFEALSGMCEVPPKAQSFNKL